MNEEYVAVLVPVYNAINTIQASLKSVEHQTSLKHNGGNLCVRLILVDNGSTDGTFQSEEFNNLLKRFEEQTGFEETVILSCKERGIVPALNVGLFEIFSLRSKSNNMKYNYIARLDADDEWKKEKLSKQFEFLQNHPNVSVLGTGLTLVDKTGRKVGSLVHPTDDFTIKTNLLNGKNAIAHPSVVMKTDLFRRAGVYDSTFPFAEDLHLWLKAIPWYNFANLEEELTKYTVSNNPGYNSSVTTQLSRLFKDAYSNFSYKT